MAARGRADVGSIGGVRGEARAARRVSALGWLLLTLAPTALAGTARPLHECRDELERARLGDRVTVAIPVAGAAERAFALPPGRRVLIEATEHGIDALLEAEGSRDPLALRADTPTRRAGTLHVLLPATRDAAVRVRLSSKEHEHAKGSVEIALFDLDHVGTAARCLKVAEMLAAADADYSIGVDISYARRSHGTLRSRHAYLRAAEEYRVAYETADAERDPDIRASAALALSSTYLLGIKDWIEMGKWGERARDFGRQAGEPYIAARGEALMIDSWYESPRTPTGEIATGAAVHAIFERARAALRDLERFHFRRHEAYDAAIQRYKISETYGREGNFQACIDQSERARRLFHAQDEVLREGGSLANKAWCEWGLDRLDLAEKHLREALALQRSEARWYLSSLLGLAHLSLENGRVDEALRASADALRRSEQLQGGPLTEASLYALGATYLALGDPEQAIYYLEQATPSQSPNEHNTAIFLRSLAVAYRQSGSIAKARATEERALRVAFSTPAAARIEIAIATDDTALGNSPAALDRLTKVLASSATALPSVHAEALIARGHVNAALGNQAMAAADLNAALQQLHVLQDPRLEYQAHLEAARLELGRGSLDAALRYAEHAIEVGQILRQQSANPDLRAQRQEPLRQAYDVKLSILTAQRRERLRSGRAAEARDLERAALVAADGSRGQALLEFSSLDLARALTPADGADFGRRQALYHEFATQLSRLDSRVDALGDDDPKVRESRATVARLRREIDSLNARMASRGAGAAQRSAPDPAAWSRWLAAHAPDTVLLEYWLGEGGAYGWTVTADGVRFFELGPTAAIDRQARAVHEAMRNGATVPASARIGAAAELYRLILRPLEATLASHHRVIIVADQALAYVSFAGLVARAGERPRYVVETHDIASAPALWWLFRPDPTRTEPASGGVLIVDDPVYEMNDPRLAAHPAMSPADDASDRDLRPRLSRLTATSREGSAVSELFPPASVHRLEGTAATRARFLAEPLDGFRFIHVASHGLVDSRMPQLASLVLSEFDEHGPVEEPVVRAADVMGLRLRADVVTLSACDTALGRQIAGEGAAGIGYAVLARGAKSVLASLWPVSDEITADVMTDFYRALRRPQVGPADALGEAMRAVLKARPGLDPAYWAAYQVTLGTPPAEAVRQVGH